MCLLFCKYVMSSYLQILFVLIIQLTLLFTIIVLQWYFVWKLLLQHLPIIREFFDLDVKQNKTTKIKLRDKRNITKTF